MALQVIGAGFPRTGTASLKAALEQLGVGACYHMSECLGRPNHWQQWALAADGGAVDWDELFEGYAATTDAPACHFYEALAAKYPRAKLILTKRDPDRWFESTQATILSAVATQRFAGAPPAFNAMMHKLGWHPADAAMHDREKMIARLTAHEAAVERTIPRSRLLVFELGEGWEPLCEFLDRPIPGSPFPHINSTEDFREMMKSMTSLEPGSVRRALDEQLAKK